MNIRTPLIRAALAAAMIGGAFTFGESSIATASPASMSIDSSAPVHATLMPELSVVGHAGNPDGDVVSHIAANGALPVTLMPTVHVVASVDEFVTLTPPYMRVVAQAGAERAHPTHVDRID